MSSPQNAPLNDPPSELSAMLDDGALLQSLPVGVYVCDADGLITRYNRAAAELWGREPELGEPDERFCGSHRLLDLDNNHIPHAQCPMAIALATGEGYRDQRIQVERPDGTRITVLVNIEPIKDHTGQVVGAINVFRDSGLHWPTRTASDTGPIPLEQILQALPAAIYATDASGKITFYNEAAVNMWGLRPEIGQSGPFGAWKLYWPDGTALPHDRSPMAIALREHRAIKGQELVSERPDGQRIPFLAYPTPLFNEAGELAGAVNMLVDISGRKAVELPRQRLAAIVESSQDAILSKDVNGIIMSWNRGAERVFGYREDEVIGKPVTILIPEDRQDEEPRILARIRRGERIEHYETVRQRKDGSLIDISLSVSPIVDADGKVVGASKIARDISDRRRAEEQKDILLREMDHRVKNLFALASGLVNLSARSATSVPELVSDLQGKFLALNRAHSLTLASTETGISQIATLHSLIAEVTEPYCHDTSTDRRITVTGADTSLGRHAATNIALLIHEFATNALKYGALSDPSGRVEIECSDRGGEFCMIWRETSKSSSVDPDPSEGFGSRLARAAIGSLNGRFSRTFTDDGLEIRLEAPLINIQE